MERRSRRLPCSVIPLLSLLAGNAGAAPTALDRYAGTFSGSGTILEGPDATAHQVRCRFTILQRGATGLALQGTCRAYLIISRSISADLAWDPRSGQVTGTYTGSRVGTARLTGRRAGTDFDLTIEWPKLLYGDRTAQMKVASLGPDRFRIVVTDRIGVNGPVRATTDLTLLRHRRRRRRDAQLCRPHRGAGVRPAGVFRTRPAMLGLIGLRARRAR
jgi:hypothetical protein